MIWGLHNFPPSAAPVSCRLESLTLSLSNSIHKNAYESVFLPSRHTLRHLRLHTWGDDAVEALVSFLATTSLTSLRALEITQIQPYNISMRIFSVLPSLESLTLENVLLRQVLESLATAHTSTIKVLTIVKAKRLPLELPLFPQVLCLPVFAGVRQLSLPGVRKFELEGLEGIALLEECEKRDISFCCQYGYL